MQITTEIPRHERIWRSHAGKGNFYISEMVTEYLENCINMINRGTDLRGNPVSQEAKDKLPWLVEELALRNESEGWDE